MAGSGNIFKIERDLVLKCRCSAQLWFILIDKPGFERITGFQCSFCAETIEINLIDYTDKNKKHCALWRDCKGVNGKNCGKNCTSWCPV